MFQFLKRHIIKATYSLRRGGRHYHFGVVFQVGGESERAFFAFFITPPKGHCSSAHSYFFLERTPARRRNTAVAQQRVDQSPDLERLALQSVSIVTLRHIYIREIPH
jgi:hypothetical protein